MCVGDLGLATDLLEPWLVIRAVGSQASACPAGEGACYTHGPSLQGSRQPAVLRPGHPHFTGRLRLQGSPSERSHGDSGSGHPPPPPDAPPTTQGPHPPGLVTDSERRARPPGRGRPHYTCNNRAARPGVRLQPTQWPAPNSCGRLGRRGQGGRGGHSPTSVCAAGAQRVVGGEAGEGDARKIRHLPTPGGRAPRPPSDPGTPLGLACPTAGLGSLPPGELALGRRAGCRWPCHLGWLSLALTLEGGLSASLVPPSANVTSSGSLPDRPGQAAVRALGRGACCAGPQARSQPPPVWGFSPPAPFLASLSLPTL